MLARNIPEEHQLQMTVDFLSENMEARSGTASFKCGKERPAKCAFWIWFISSSGMKSKHSQAKEDLKKLLLVELPLNTSQRFFRQKGHDKRSNLVHWEKKTNTRKRELWVSKRNYPFSCGFYKLYLVIETKIIIPSGTLSK